MIRNTFSLILTGIINSLVYVSKKIGIIFSFFHFIGIKIKSFFKGTSHVMHEGLVALLICAIGDLIAGIILGKMTFFLETFPGLLVLIPGAIGMRGNIFGSFASRLGTNLHIGILSPELKKSEVLTENVLSSIILTLVLSIFLAILAKILCIIFNYPSMDLIDFLLISLFTGIISSVIMLPISMVISLKSFQYGWDPDNITNPLITASGDLFTLPSIILSIFLLSIISNIYVKYIIIIIIISITILSFYYGLKMKGAMKRILKQSAPILIFSSFLGVSAGGILNSVSSTLLNNPTLLTLVPLFSGESGSLISILSARLSSALHSGLINENSLWAHDKETLRNFSIIFVLSLFIYPFIGFLAEASSVISGAIGLGFFKTVLISLIAGLILISIMTIFVFSLSSISYKKGYDPDNIVIPVSTSLTDLISNMILIAISLLVFFIVFI
jgi:mgtE-like transporter